MKTVKTVKTDRWSRADQVVSSLIVHARSESGGGFVKGCVRTPHGYVNVHSEGLQYVTTTPLIPSEGSLLITRLSIVLGGREKERVIEDAYSDQRLATLARDFALEAARESHRTSEKESVTHG